MTSGGGTGGQVDVLYVDVQARTDERSFRQMEGEVENAGERAGKKGGGKLSEAFGGLIGSLPALAATAAAAVGAALVGGTVAAVDFAQQARQGVIDMQASLGSTTEEAQRLGEIAKGVFGNNWTGSLAEAQQAVVNVRKEIKDLAEKDVQAVTEGTVAIAEKFEEEQPRVAAAVQAVMKATGASAQEAMDFITAGFQKGLNSSGDFLDTLTEYSPQFEKAKIGSGELFSLLETGAAKGALGTDKIADAFKEFGLTVVSVNDSSKATYKELGIDQEKLVSAINNGSVTQAQAFELVTNKLRDVKGQADRTNIASSIFGGAGEDFANGLTQLDLTKTKVGDLKGATQQVQDATNTMGAVFQTAWRQVLIQLQPVGDLLLDLANEAMPTVKAAINQLGPVVTQVVRFLVDGFRQGRQVAGEFAPYLTQALSTFRPAVQAIGPLFTSVFGLVRTLWETVLKPVLTVIGPVVAGTWAQVGNVLTLVVRVVTGVVNAVSALLRGDLGGAVKAVEGIFEDGVTFVVRSVRTLGTTILGVIKQVAPQMAGAAADIIRGLVGGIQNGAGQVVQAAQNLAGNIVSAIKTKLRIQSPSRETMTLGEFAALGIVSGIEKTKPEVQKSASGLAKVVTDETQKARDALEKDIRMDAWVDGLRRATVAQLEHAQALARSQGDAVRYDAIKAELTRRQDAQAAATDKATEAARREREELSNNRAQINRTETMERYVLGLRNATAAQLASALNTARAAGEVERYNAIKSEQERRENAVTAATQKAADAARQHAEQLAQNRRAIQDGLTFDAYVEGLRGYTDQQLAAARSNALAAGDGQKWNAVLAEQKARADEAAQAVSDLADAQIRAASQRYQDTQGATDGAYRLSYGAGDEGLIRSLAAVTGLSVAAIRSDVQGALDDAKKYAPQAAATIERVWADALKHRREVAEQEKATNAALLASDQETSRARTGAIAELSRAEGEAADDAAVTVTSLTGMIRELVSQGRDPAQTGFTDWLDELIQKGGLAGAAAATVKKNLADLIAAAQLAQSTPGAMGGPVEARGTPGTEMVTPSAARPVVSPQPVMTETGARGSLLENTPDEKAWQGTVRAKQAADEYRQTLRGLTADQLAQAQAYALATGRQEDYNLVVEEGERRAKVAADSTRLITEAESELHTTLTGETIPAYEARARVLEEQAEKDAEHAGRLRELAGAIRATGKAAEENAAKLNVAVRIAGIDTGIKALDLYKTALTGVGDVIQGVFSDLVSGSETGVQGILTNMAKMALGIVKSVAVSIAAYEAQAIALALISGASFNFVQAGLALAAAAAVAGIAAGLEARLSQQTGASTGTSGASASTSTPSSTSSSTSQDNSLVSIPTSQVTVMAAPEWAGMMLAAAKEFREGVAEFREVNRRGVRVSVQTESAAQNLAYDLATGGL